MLFRQPLAPLSEAAGSRPLRSLFGTGCARLILFIVIHTVALSGLLPDAVGAAASNAPARARDARDRHLLRSKIPTTSAGAQSILKASRRASRLKEVRDDEKQQRRISAVSGTSSNVRYPELGNDMFTVHRSQLQLSRRAQDVDEEVCTNMGGTVVDGGCRFCYRNDDEEEVCCTTDTPEYVNHCDQCLDDFPSAKECAGFSDAYDFDTDIWHYRGCGVFSNGIACYHVECVSIFDCTCKSVTWNDDDCGACTIGHNYLVYDCSSVGGHTTPTVAPTTEGTAEPTSSFHRMEREALEAFYMATGGDDRYYKYRWLKGDHCNDWHGVDCDQDGHVIRLYLGFSNMVGTIPTEIGWLTQLEHLDIDDNELAGPIPTEVGKLTHLEKLHLQENSMTGPIPTEIGKLTKLKMLDLKDNNLTGSIPKVLGKLEKFKGLYLARNELTGPIPTEIGRLEQLGHLGIGKNKLTGPIPTEIGRLTQLQILNLGDNNLTGTIPEEIGGLKPLRKLQLEGNSLTGPMPTGIGNLTLIRYFYLGHNNLTGSIPTEIGELTQFQYIDLKENSLTGSIPKETGKLTKLRIIKLDQNSLTGSLPTEIGYLVQLESLYLSGNKLSGIIPTEVGELTKLRYIDLIDNFLTGPVPTEIGQLIDLRSLWLNDNTLTGPIPSEIGYLKKLGLQNISGNLLTGSIPTEIGYLTELTTLDLKENRLTGPIPTEMGELLQISELALQSNNLNGPVPEALGSILGLKNLDLSRNKLQAFPFDAEWPYLQSLDLRHNMIWQEIPTELNGLSQIKQLLLSNNAIYGSIPYQLGNLLRMEELHLDSNRLYGTIPDDLLFLTRLRVLNLSHNHGRLCFDSSNCNYGSGSRICCDETGTFCTKKIEYDSEYGTCVTGVLGFWGTIPAGFGNVPYLKILDLSYNSLTGSIPPELGDLPRLETLDISNNKLNGAIPSDLGALVEANISLTGNDFRFLDANRNHITKAPLSLCSVIGFDLANNITWCPPERNALKNFYESAKGQEWTETSGWVGEYNDHCEWDGVHCDNLTGKVVELLLKNNGLSGRIDSSIGDLTSLVTLDLHDNDLQGSIPTALGRLMNLSRVRFSFNALTGQVPGDLQNISELTLLHLHGNRLTGTTPGFKFQTLDSHSTFIADCGSPSDYDAPLECSDCTMCCNSIGECDTRKSYAFMKGLSYGELAAIVMGSIAALFCIVATLARFSKRSRNMISLILFRPSKGNSNSSSGTLSKAHTLRGNAPNVSNIMSGPMSRKITRLSESFKNAFSMSHGRNPLPPIYAWNAIGEESVYSFLLTTSWGGWFVSTSTLAVQTFAFVVFIDAAELDFGDDSKDWVYSWRCPRNSDTCDDKKDDLTQGWVFFAILMAVHLAPDLINGLKLLGMFVWQNRLSRKSFQCFVGGLCLFLISALALYASVIYNLAIARSNTELITNAVIIIFINDIDEQLYFLLGVVCPRWLDGLANQARRYPKKSTRQDKVTLRPRTSSEEGGNSSGDSISLEVQELKSEFEEQKQQMERLRMESEQEKERLRMESEQFKSTLAILRNKIDELPVEQKSVISIAPICVGTVGANTDE